MGATSDKIQGQAKQAAGVVTGDKDLEAEGKADRQVGEVEEKIDEVKDKAADLADKAKNKLLGT